MRGWQNYRSFLGVTFNIQYSVSIDRCLRAAPENRSSFERSIFNSFLKVQTHTSQIEEEDDEKDIE